MQFFFIFDSTRGPLFECLKNHEDYFKRLLIAEGDYKFLVFNLVNSLYYRVKPRIITKPQLVTAVSVSYIINN